ncbi:MAG: hypothetical protein HC804_10685, partial [Anaerolineae bacterium]|nr:hypothetical protein [Anaerolineae bacterium]
MDRIVLQQQALTRGSYATTVEAWAVEANRALAAAHWLLGEEHKRQKEAFRRDV